MPFELIPLLELARASQFEVVCSLRDLIMTQKMSQICLGLLVLATLIGSIEKHKIFGYACISH